MYAAVVSGFTIEQRCELGPRRAFFRANEDR